MKDVGKKLKEDDAGYALLYTLGVIILIGLLMMGIFMNARNNYVQISEVDKITKTKDIKEYALQDASAKLKKAIREKVSANENLGKGRSKAEDVAYLKPSMVEVAAELKDKLKKTGIGKNKDFSYEVTILTEPTVVATNEVYKFVSDESTGENGWIKISPTKEFADVTNTKTTFALEVKVTRDKKNASPMITTDHEDYVYEFQWEKRKLTQSNGKQTANQNETQKLETWRYIYYDTPLSNGEEVISADAWTRKMDRIYNYQSDKKEFPWGQSNVNKTSWYDPTKDTTYGYHNTYKFLSDYKDRDTLPILNFWNRRELDPISSSLTFEGSFLIYNNPFLKGKGNGQLTTKNMLGLSNINNPNRVGSIYELSVTAGTGIYIDQIVKEQYYQFVIQNQAGKEIKTPNLLINHSGVTNNKNTAGTSSGVYLSKGTVIQEASTSEINFAEYDKDSKTLNPQDQNWAAFMNGGFVVAGSAVYLTPTIRHQMNIDHLGGLVNYDPNLDDIKPSTKEDERKIILKDGNFMLTSASMENGKGEETLSYFDRGIFGSTPRQPSLLELEGENTSMVVENGVSFIDAPKTRKRTDSKKKGSYYSNSKYWNTIRLKEKSYLDLGTAGVEPFNLEMEEDTVLTMKLLPELLLFDTTFIEKAFKVGTESIKGKLILKPATVEDATKLNDSLKKLSGVKVSVKTDEKDAVNGEVTIITPTVPVNTTAGWVTQRVFEHSEMK
ncbi:hypothetical protein [Enterococcus sp. UD-01]|uniref:hypothetical protein n=1 Tax=Enterococcus sp. UD-01 TaxID=3373911 RepID=UPI0038332AE1